MGVTKPEVSEAASQPPACALVTVPEAERGAQHPGDVRPRGHYHRRVVTSLQPHVPVVNCYCHLTPQASLFNVQAARQPTTPTLAHLRQPL